MSKKNGKNEGGLSQGEIIQINEEQIKGHLDEMVRGTVEEMLNGLLEAEAEQLIGAGRYERSAQRQDTRAGHYERNFDMKVGRVKLQMPKLRKLTFETSIIERYKRRESSVEEALIEMYLAGVSVRRVEDITEALWGTRVSPGTVSNLNKKIYEQIEVWRNRPLKGSYPFVYLDGIWLKRSWRVSPSLITSRSTCRRVLSSASRFPEIQKFMVSHATTEACCTWSSTLSLRSGSIFARKT